MRTTHIPVRIAFATHAQTAPVEAAAAPAERLALIEGQHRSLDQKIIELQARPWQNQLLVQRLKKEKLRLKEVIERLKGEMIPDLNA